MRCAAGQCLQLLALPFVQSALSALPRKVQVPMLPIPEGHSGASGKSRVEQSWRHTKAPGYPSPQEGLLVLVYTVSVFTWAAASSDGEMVVGLAWVFFTLFTSLHT